MVLKSEVIKMDFTLLRNEYKAYKSAIVKFRFFNHKYGKYRKENFELLDDCLEEYYSNLSDKKKIDNLLSTYPELKTYLSLEFLKEHYRQEIEKFRNPSFSKYVGFCVLYVENNKKIIFDLESKMCFDVTELEQPVFDYLISSLNYNNKYVGEVSKNDLVVLEVIKEEVIESKSVNNNNIAKKIFSELIKAKAFDNFYMITNQSEKNSLPFNVDEELRKLLVLFKDDKISKEEYLVRNYYLLILKTQNPEQLYIDASDENKKYVLDAYIKLSSFGQNNTIHQRTTSRIINEQVLKRKRNN